MRFPRYWAKARDTKLGVAAWGWSDEGQAFAEAQARARLAHIASSVASGDYASLSRYGYGERALREPVLEELASSVITRNSYGCEVLNTAGAMFVDIDLPKASSWGMVGRFLGKKATDPASEALARVEGWLARNADWGFRAYRTKAGVRLLATHSTIDPVQGEATMSALGADPLYLRLCRAQKSYRARLTPKPWRCGVRPPAAGLDWPFADVRAEERFAAWQRAYREKASRYASCRFLRSLGNPGVDRAVAPLVALHDERTRATTDLPLA